MEIKKANFISCSKDLLSKVQAKIWLKVWLRFFKQNFVWGMNFCSTVLVA